MMTLRSFPIASSLQIITLKRFHRIGTHHHNHHHRTLSENPIPAQTKHRNEGAKITWIGLWTNVFLTGTKGVGGILLNSPVLLADAFHSGSDLLSDFVTLFTFNRSLRPANEYFPYGYGKLETLGSLAVSGLLAVGALGISYHSFQVLADAQIHTNHIMNTNLGLSLALFSVISKETLYQWTLSIGKRLNSPVLIANAWHHRSDAATSLVAVAGLLGTHFGYGFLDPIGGLVVAGIIGKAAAEVGGSGIRELLDGITNPKLQKELIQHISSRDLPDFTVEKIYMHKKGPYFHAEVRIKLKPETRMEQVSTHLPSIEADIRKYNSHVKYVTFTINPK